MEVASRQPQETKGYSGRPMTWSPPYSAPRVSVGASHKTERANTPQPVTGSQGTVRRQPTEHQGSSLSDWYTASVLSAGPRGRTWIVACLGRALMVAEALLFTLRTRVCSIALAQRWAATPPGLAKGRRWLTSALKRPCIINGETDPQRTSSERARA